MLLYLLLFTLAAGSCPPRLPESCTCSNTGYTEYHCLQGAGDGATGVLVKASLNKMAKITCQEGTLTCPGMLQLHVSNNKTLNFLHVNSCALAGSAACVARALGAPGVRSLRLQNQPHELMGEHLLGLQDLEKIDLEYAAAQTTLPLDVFANLPALKDVTISGGHLQLTPGPWPDDEHLNNLELVDDDIKAIPVGAFSSLKNLTRLSLWKNQIANISSDAFKGLNQLQTLDLSRNPLQELQDGVFRETPRLQNLTLVHTDLKVLRTDALRGLSQFQNLHIDLGRFVLALEDMSLAYLPGLRTIKIRMVTLSLPDRLFEGSTGLVEVTLMRTGLRTLPEKLFEGLVHLEVLYLNGNRMSVLNERLFEDLASLKSLDLSDNQLQTLPENVFAGLESLESLRVDGNRLVRIASGVFNGPRLLRHLSLRHNLLTLCDDGEGESVSPFMPLLQLVELDVSFNHVAAVCRDWRLTWVHHIRRIDLRGNRITTLKAEDLEFVADVSVDLRHNEISTIHVGSDSNKNTTFVIGHNPFVCDCNIYPFLASIRTNDTPTFVTEDAYCDSPSEFKKKLLTDISTDSLTCPTVNCPENCTCLLRPAKSVLELVCSKVPELEYYPNPNLYGFKTSKLKLETFSTPIILPNHVAALNISNLNLSDVPIFPETVTELDLRFNALETLPKWVFQRNLSLYLPTNTLKCDCLNQEAITNIHKNSFKIYNFADVVCEDGTFLMKIDVNSMCNVYHAFIIGASLAAVGFLAVIIAVLVHYYSRDVKAFIYKTGLDRLLHKLGIHVYEQDIDGRMYDVMISYSDEKERFVVESFIPILEDDGYTVCVRFRDWDIGDFIPKRVAELVEKSRRTVVFLTKDYFESVASLELQAALISEKKDQRSRVLLIVSEDFHPDSHLKAFLETRKLLVAEETAFWSRLRQKLPRKSQKRAERGKLTQKTLNVMFTEEGRVKYSQK